MKIEPSKFSTLLKRASMWSGSPELERVELNFQDEGVTLAQKNAMDTIGVCYFGERTLFEEYEAIGRVQIPTEKVVDALRVIFKRPKFKCSCTVDVEFKDGSISIDGEKEHYERDLPDDDLPTKEYSVNPNDFGIIPQGLEVEMYHTLPNNSLENVFDTSVGNDISDPPKIYKFIFGENLIVVHTWKTSEDSSVNIVEPVSRRLSNSNTLIEAEGSTKIASDYFNDALSQMSGEFTLGFVGDDAPVILTSRDEHSAWCYLIAPWGGQ